MAESRFSPASAGSIVSDSMALYREHFTLLVSIALLPHLIILVALFFFGMFFAMILAIPLSAMTLGALVLATGYVLLGEQVSAIQIYKVLLARGVGQIIGGYLFTNILIFMGFIFFFLPGLLVGGLLVLVIPVIVLEGRNFMEALRRASGLMRENLLRGVALFVFFILVAQVIPLLMPLWMLIAYPPVIDPQLAGTAAEPPEMLLLLTNLWNVAAGALSLPLGFLPVILLYFSFRGSEGYGPEELAKSLGVTLPNQTPNGGDDKGEGGEGGKNNGNGSGNGSGE